MIAYFDTSALVKLLVDESGSDVAADLWDSCDAVVSSRLAMPEVFAALGAAVRAHRLTEFHHGRALRSWELLAGSIRWVELTGAVSSDASELALRHPLSGADAVHLASCRVLGIESAILATWDRRLWIAGKSEQFITFPAQLG